MDTGLVDRITASAEEWTCECGRVNALGLSMCPRCGRVPPRGVAKTTVIMDRAGRPTWQPKVRGVRLALAVIGLNVVNTIFFIVLVETGHMEDSTAITLQTFLGLLLYGVMLTLSTGPLLVLRPAWLKGDPRTARLLGAEVGFAAALALIGLSWLASGHPLSDTSVEALVSEASLVRIALAFFLVAVAAPVVEELVFRGVVCESLRRRGAAVAIGLSAFLFGLAHLELSVVGLASKTAGGVILGLLYWRRGLWASISAHAVYNGSLVLMAVFVALGPTHVLSANGISVSARADWHVIDTAGATGPVEFALRGPSGSTFAIERFPAQQRFSSVDEMASSFNANQVPLPEGTTLQPGSAHVTEYPIGRAVQIAVTQDGHAGVVVLLPRTDALWEVDVKTQGSHRAVAEYPDMLRSLVLPGA